ncbi:unnamed protein product [Rhizoctonia solani]|uniref:MYND-type domain-containing protein n=1 Tax=Rhizoctonia solani TaxID=456999 RepID=A0A8H3HXU3_9AGAM|nr:unnamed protein product [Rhizoctonia solani]
MTNAPPGTHLDLFWSGAAELIAGEFSPMALGYENRLKDILSPSPEQPPALQHSKLTMLFNLIHGDLKNFLIALMTADSLHLSGMLFILYKYLEVEQKARGDAECIRTLYVPYSRIFRRYRLVHPDINHEGLLLTLIFSSLPGMSTLRDKFLIDDEDSRNVIHAYNQCLRTTLTISCKDAAHLMGFIKPLFTPRCEDLMPSIIDSTFWLFWETWPEIEETDTMARVVQAYGLYFLQIFDESMKPLRSNPEPWRFELVDVMMRSNILELIFRLALALSDSSTPDTERATKGRIKALFESTIAFWEKAVDYTPKDYFEQRLIKSGLIDEWFRYFAYFTERLYCRPSAADDIVLPFTMLFSRAVTAILGMKWSSMQFSFQVTGTCEYPRCAYPTNASTGCSGCMKAVYCSPRCLARSVFVYIS